MNDVTSAKILFVEDEEAVLSSMKKFFDKQGFFTLGARSSEEALTLATRHKPDIAILDVMLHEGPEGQKDDGEWKIFRKCCDFLAFFLCVIDKCDDDEFYQLSNVIVV